MTKTIVSLLILLTLFSINTFAANSPPRQKGLLGFRFYVSSVAFSPDGSTLASGASGIGGSSETRVRLWDVASGQPKTTLIEYTNEVHSLVFSPDGSILASGDGDKTVRLWEDSSGRLKTVLAGHSAAVYSVAFSPDGSTLASGSADGTVRLWAVASGQIEAILIGHTDRVYSVAFSPDGSTLASGSSDKTVRLWDVVSRQPKAILTGHTGGVSSVAFSPDGSTLASGSSNTVHLWNVTSGQLKTRLIGHSDSVYSVAFSPDGSTLASGSEDGTVRLWNAVSGQLKAILTGHTWRAYSVAFSSDGSTLASGGGETIYLWDLTASATTSAIVSIFPPSTQSLTIGEQLTVSLNIVGGENVVGYQATVVFDPDALIYFSSANGEYLSDGAFFAAPDVGKNYVTLASAALAGESNGDGVLATITFHVVDTKASGLFLSQVHLVDPEGERLFPCIENGTVGDDTIEDGAVIESVSVYRVEDINDDGVVNIQDLVLVSSNFGQRGENEADINGDGVVDIVDLVKVAGAFGNNVGAAPSFHSQALKVFTAADIRGWLTQAQHLNLTDVASQRGIRFLEQLLAVLTPKETVLLPNYPNPFNPETWIPYQLANPSDVQIVIYDTRGIIIRRLALGYQAEGYYTTRSRAAYWDGHNDLGERVATGVYFYQLQADGMSPPRKMVILK